MTTNVRSQDPVESVRELLCQQNPQQALTVAERSGQHDEAMQNARGVCLMRLGKVEPAVEVLRNLAFRGQICIPSDTPPLHKANYATALLMKGYTQQAMDILAPLRPDQHPYIAALWETIAAWKQSLTPFQRLLCMVKYYPSKPVPLRCEPGSL